MNARERVYRAITMTGPDRAPIHHYIFPGAFYRHGEALVRVAQQYPDDFGNAVLEDNLREQEGEKATMQVVEWRDAWGTLWRRLAGYTSGDVVEPGIPTWDVWANYQVPPPPGPEHFEEVRRRFEAQRGQVLLMGSGGSLFQHLQHVRGPANLLMDLADDCREVHELADAVVDRLLYCIREYLAAGAECITFGDDWGAQDRLLASPATWRRFFKPRYKRLFDAAKDAGALVWFHSDGWILDIIPDLIEIGVDVLNPQHKIMGDERVAAVAGGKVCIRTDIDRQWLIPQGDPEEIREYVKRVLKLFGDYNGGIILHGEIGPDVPLENVRALYAAFYDYGRYPLSF